MSLRRAGSTLALAGICLAACLGLETLSAERPKVDLAGSWDFYPDVGDAPMAGVTAKPGRIVVPGAWQAQGYGTPGGTIPSANIGPGTSPAEYLRHNLMGRCLYARNVPVPAEWRAKRVFLCVRRAYRYTDVTVNGKRIGEYEGFSTPFEFDVTEAISFGSTNQLVIGVDNRPRPGRDTLGTGNLYGNWGGLGGAVYLEARAPVWMDDVFAIPRVNSSAVELQITVRTADPAIPGQLSVTGQVQPWKGDVSLPVAGEASTPVTAVSSHQQTVALSVAIANARLWTPDDPFLYTARMRLSRQGQVVDELPVRFGLREITAEGGKLYLNGKPLYLSGYGDDATEPITGMLPADKNIYERRLKLMRSFGFNFVRHHSCVPHDEYFEVADEVGMLVQPEAGMAYTGFWRTGRQLFEQEWPAMVRAFRNHPSIWAWCMGNELFLGEFPERSAGRRAGEVDLAQPLTNGPLKTVEVEDNGVFGTPGQYPAQSFKRSNYYRDVGCLVDGKTLTLLGDAKSSHVFTDGPHELGLKITADRDTPLTQIRYFRVPEEQGNHVGRLWDEKGAEVAKVSFVGETSSGWQVAVLPSPVTLKGGRQYVVSVNANTAYAATSSGSVDAAVSREEILEVVANAYRTARAMDPTRLVHASDGGSLHQFTDVFSSGGREKFAPKPFLLHEYGTYCCSLPDLTLIPRLNGVTRPLTYERAEAYIRDRRLEKVYPQLLRSSLVMRADAQKHYMESAKASGANNGFSFWLGIDFPESPEGCWDEGILNELWQPKPYLTNGLPDILGSTVLLCDAGLGARSFYNDEPKKVGLRLWHYGAKPISSGELSWCVTEGESVIRRGALTGLSCASGERVMMGDVTLGAISAPTPRFIKLEVDLLQDGQRIAKNAWGFYVYPRQTAATLPGVYSQAGPLRGATVLGTNAPLPGDLRLLITRNLNRARHEQLLRAGKCAVLLLGNGGFKETRAGYFLNQYGSGFGGIIEDHPVFSAIPHEGRLHLGLYQLIAGGGLLETGSMPAPLRDGAVVWGLKLTGWISPAKNLGKVLHWSEIVTQEQLHLVLCNLDLASDKPESHYVLAKALDYLVSAQPSPLARRCSMQEIESLMGIP